MAFTFTITSELPAAPAAVWEQVSTMQGVNAELMPLLRMTAPPDKRHVTFQQVPLKQPLFSSWLLLFGILPFDLHHLQLDEVWEGGFRENSTSLLQRTWRHERIIVSGGIGTHLTDTITFEPRLPLVGHVILPIVRALFRHRHRQLQRLFS